MGLTEDIGTGPVGIDTAVFIYFITVYLTNDRDLPPVPGLRVLQLRDYLPDR